MKKPLINGDLVDAAAALVLCQHDSPYALDSKSPSGSGKSSYWETEENLDAARSAASAYLVACFNAAMIWNDDDE